MIWVDQSIVTQLFSTLNTKYLQQQIFAIFATAHTESVFCLRTHVKRRNEEKAQRQADTSASNVYSNNICKDQNWRHKSRVLSPLQTEDTFSFV